VLLVGAHERAGDDAAALATILRGLADAPDDPRLLVLRANMAAKHGDFDAALAEYDRVLLRAPHSVQAWLGKGKILGARGEKTGAMRAFRQAAELDPSSFEAHYNAGAMLAASGELSAAMPYLVRAYEQRGSSPVGKTLRETLLQVPMQSPDTFVALATADADRRDPDGALEWLSRALSIDPDHGPALFLKGGMLKDKGRLEEALSAWKHACDVLPDSLLAAMSTGTLLMEMGDRDGAREYFVRALAVAEGSASGSAEARAAIPVLRARITELGGQPK
jgi:tetratricopeptide (TPR) repeat protein